MDNLQKNKNAQEVTTGVAPIEQPPLEAPAAEYLPTTSAQTISEQTAGQTAVSPQTVGQVPQLSAQPEMTYAPIQKVKHEYTMKDRLLLPIALLIGILCDRLVFGSAEHIEEGSIVFFTGIFWLCYLVIFYALFWKRIKKDIYLWAVTAFLVLLCLWNVVFDYNSVFGYMSFLAMPSVLMAHAVYSMGSINIKEIGTLFFELICGWIIKPFSAIGYFFGSIGSMTGKGSNKKISKVLVALLIVLPLLAIVIPLLSSADLVVSHYIGKIFEDFNISRVITHTVWAFCLTMFFFSFLWNIRGAERTLAPSKPKSFSGFDKIISTIILGAVLLVYVLFCGVQVLYLFGGAGLPKGITYSEYAREGFLQLILIAGINLVLFGIFVKYDKKTKLLWGLLSGILAVTMIMLISAIIRLWMYVDAYGLTWLRLISAWFIVFLAAVLILAVVRLIKEQLPLIGVCLLLLLGWYTALGFANPDALIVKYNLAACEDKEDRNKWVHSNFYKVSSLSDNAMIVLMQSDTDKELVMELVNYNREMDYAYSSDAKYNLTSKKAMDMYAEYKKK